MFALYTRREFVRKAAQVTGSMALAAGTGGKLADASHSNLLPRRKLGRTGREVSVLGLGLASLGMAQYSPKEFQAVVQTALDEGVNYFDVQPNYGEAEKYLAPLLKKNREALFIVTKTWEQDKQKVLNSIAESRRRLGLSSIDAVLLNNIGDYDLKQLFRPEGALAGLREARRCGQLRFFGLSGHWRPRHFSEALNSGEFDIVMAPFNFVDRHIYNFEQEILPVAARFQVGVVAMKALGGAVGLKYDTREQRAMLQGDDYRFAIRYVLGLSQISCAVVGCKSVEEIQLAARVVRSYRPLNQEETTTVLRRGKEMAEQWGTHYPEG